MSTTEEIKDLAKVLKHGSDQDKKDIMTKVQHLTIGQKIMLNDEMALIEMQDAGKI